jgi:DHA3 family macrolide efflux protein-like MFS transporter
MSVAEDPERETKSAAPSLRQLAGDRLVKSFLLIWGAQTVSTIGTGLTGFALSVWIYQTTRSVTQFTLMMVLGTLPGLLLSPVLGVFVDRFDRRWTLIFCSLGSALRTSILMFLLATNRLEVWHLYFAALLRSLFDAVQLPASLSLISQMVPREQLGRANGLVQFSATASHVVAPGLAGLLILRIGLSGILLVDVLTFVVAIAALAVAYFPQRASASPALGEPFFQRVLFGWRYIRERPSLLSLLSFFALLNFFVGSAFALVTPLVLSFESAPELGLTLSIGSLGALLGSVFISAWGGPRRRIYGILAFSPLLGLGYLLIGIRPSLALIVAGTACVYFSVPVVNSLSQAIWQQRVEPKVQGRVFATQRLAAQVSLPIAYLLAGPLADYLLVPLLLPEGPLAGTVGRILGVGPGRGIGLQFILMGLFLLLLVAGAWLHPRLRRVEADTP